MKYIKKTTLMILAMAVFTYTSFAIEHNKNQTELLGKSEKVKLMRTNKPYNATEQKLTPVAVVVVVLIVTVSISPAWFAGPQRQNEASSATIAAQQEVALHNLD